MGCRRLDKAKVNTAMIGLALATAGAVVKLLGGILYGSKALLVDGVTCIASVLAGIFLVVWLRRAATPPDFDHPYGHGRLAYGAVSYTLAVYAFAAGVGFTILVTTKQYTVDVEATVYAVVGLFFYLAAILAYRKVGDAGASVAAFTASELLESTTSIVSAAGGATLSYIIDYAGAWIIEAFIIYESAKQAGELVMSLSDRADSEALGLARRELEARGFEVHRLRLRRVVPGKYHGDAIVVPPKGMPPEAADILADEAVTSLESKGIDLTVHIDITRSHSAKPDRRKFTRKGDR